MAAKKRISKKSDGASNQTEPSDQQGRFNHRLETIRICSRRSRIIIILIVITSVIDFSAFWNSRTDSWLSERIRVMEWAHMVTKQAKEQTNSFNEIDIEKIRAELTKNSDIKPTDMAWIDRALDYIEKKGFKTRGSIKTHLDSLLTLEAERKLVITVPFFGIYFDVNNLGMIGGFTFVVLLMIFRFSLVRETSNISVVLKQAQRGGRLERCYTNLAMEQVLTIPPIEGKEETQFWKHIPKFLYMLPVLVHLIIVCHDFKTIGIGFAISPVNTMVVTMTSVTFLVLLVILTYQCINLSIVMDRQWKDWYERIGADKNGS